MAHSRDFTMLLNEILLLSAFTFKNRYFCLIIVLGTIKLNEIKYASLVTAFASLRPRNGLSHPHQEHMKDTYIPTSRFLKFLGILCDFTY